MKCDPNDAAANLLVGQWYCLSQQNWQQGLANLAKSNDAELKALALQELNSPPTDPQQQVKLGDAWWDLAQLREGEDHRLCLLCRPLVSAGDGEDALRPAANARGEAVGGDRQA